MSTVVLSVRVRKELKEMAEKLGINIREVVERALEESIKEARRRLIKKLLEDLKEDIGKIPEDEWVRTVREFREGR